MTVPISSGLGGAAHGWELGVRESGMHAHSVRQASRSDNDVRRVAARLRRRTVDALYAAGSGHPGASLSIADIVAVLFFAEMKLFGELRDRFVLSKGHAAPVVYAGFCELGLLPEQELVTLRRLGSRLQGHPDRVKLSLLDAGTGALGQGLSIAIGFAIAARLQHRVTRTYCIVGDGEIQEGQVWEAAMYAGAHRLDSVCCIIDANRLQNETWVNATLPLGSIAEKWRSFGWNVLEVDGHDVAALRQAFCQARNRRDMPTVIVAHTTKGKGVSFMENNHAWHSKVMKEAEYRRAVEELETVLRQFEIA